MTAWQPKLTTFLWRLIFFACCIGLIDLGGTQSIVLHTQKRYLQVNHQYMRWLVFLGVLILVDQVEYALHLLLGQQIVCSFMLTLSIILTFSLYPFVFKFLQHYDR